MAAVNSYLMTIAMRGQPLINMCIIVQFQVKHQRSEVDEWSVVGGEGVSMVYCL